MARVDLRVTEKISWLLSKPKRVKIAVGGRGSAKSIGVGDVMLMFADKGERICCAREFQNSINDSVHENLKEEIGRLGVEGFKPLETEIRSASGGEIFYRGLARNITSLKSLAGVNRLWIEEGESVSDKSLKVLTPSIRSTASSNEAEDEPPEIWITMNRGSSADAVAVKYLKRAEDELARTGYYEDDLIMVVDINWKENPWFPPELEQERADDFKNLSRAEYDHVWEGAYNDSVDRAIIKAEWFDACIDAHIKLGIKAQGAKVVAHDPSDEGNDAKGLAYRHGVVVLHVDENKHGDVNDGMDWALEYCDEVGVDEFTWDGDGMGVGLRRQANEAFDGKSATYTMFRGSLSPEDPDRPYEGVASKENKENQDIFRNRRAQYYIRLRDRIYKTYKVINKKEFHPKDALISFDSGIDKLRMLRAELCRIPTKPNASGMIQILSKPEMEKLGIKSPNMADSVMMLMLNPRLSNAKLNEWVQPKVITRQRSASRYEAQGRIGY